MANPIAVIQEFDDVGKYLAGLEQKLKNLKIPVYSDNSVTDVVADIHIAPKSLRDVNEKVFRTIKRHAYWVAYSIQRTTLMDLSERDIDVPLWGSHVDSLFYEVTLTWADGSGTYVAQYVMLGNQPMVLQASCLPCLWGVDHECLITLLSGSKYISEEFFDTLSDHETFDWEHGFAGFLRRPKIFETKDGAYQAHQRITEFAGWSSDVVLMIVPVADAGFWDDELYGLTKRLEYMSL